MFMAWPKTDKRVIINNKDNRRLGETWSGIMFKRWMNGCGGKKDEWVENNSESADSHVEGCKSVWARMSDWD